MLNVFISTIAGGILAFGTTRAGIEITERAQLIKFDDTAIVGLIIATGFGAIIGMIVSLHDIGD